LRRRRLLLDRLQGVLLQGVTPHRPGGTKRPAAAAGDVFGERFRRQVCRILDEAAHTTTESHGGGYGSSLTRAPYPPTPPTGRIPAGARFGRLCFHAPDGTQWSPDSLREVLGPPVQHPVQAETFAGVAAGPDGLFCWVADVAARTISVLPPAPAAPAGGETPLAWTGPSLAVATAPPPATLSTAAHGDVRQVFEAAPGRRIRLSLGAPPAGRDPSAIVIVDPGTGVARPTGLGARPYRRVRGAPTGQVAALADDATTVAIGGPGPHAERAVQADGRVLDFQWLAARPPGAHLVLVTETPDGFALSCCRTFSSACSSGAGSGRTAERPAGPAGPERPAPLYRHRGRYLHSHRQRHLLVLALNDDGAYAVIIAEPDASRPSVRVLTLPLRWPTIIKIAAVRSDSAGDLAFATVDTENHVIIWTVRPGATTARCVSERTLPAGEELVTIAAWDRPAAPLVVREVPVTIALPAHPGGRAPVTGRVAGAATEFSLHLPERAAGTAAACLVWLSQRGEPLPGAATPGLLDPYWLTLAGFAVLDVRVAPRWWPEVPDKEIRPRLVEQIRAAVAGSGVARLAVGGLAVGGTSFGATLALMAAADCELFAAAIVQSGAYSRQLTPLGFQDEPRTLWEAPRVYRDFDAVMGAPRIRKPVLIIHGEADANQATPVAQATLLFQALIANGTRSRLVILSGEGHTPVSRDGIAAALAEKAAWLHAHCTR
jgi:hypothetical protein